MFTERNEQPGLQNSKSLPSKIWQAGGTYGEQRTSVTTGLGNNNLTAGDSSISGSINERSEKRATINMMEVFGGGPQNEDEHLSLKDRLNLSTPASLPITPNNITLSTPSAEGSSFTHASIKDVGKSLDNNETGEFVCHYCDAAFRNRGYLTRHIKKHAIQKAYHCPFYNESTPPDLRCHASGGFSRRDTYKTHLRVRHFIYPDGVKPKGRGKSSGHCAQCGEFFENTENWVEQHIESANCKGLPDGFLQTLKCERKPGKLRMIKTSTGHSRFISTAQSVVEPKVLLNKEALEAMAIVANNFNKNTILSKYGNNSIAMKFDDLDSLNKNEAKRVKRKYTKKKRSLSPTKTSTSSASSPSLIGSSSVDIPIMTITHKNLEGYSSLNGDNIMRSKPSLDRTNNNSININGQVIPTKLTRFSQSMDAALLPLRSLSNIYNLEDPYSVPLDMEQCPQFNNVQGKKSLQDDLVKTSIVRTSSELSIEEAFPKSLDPSILAQRTLKEDEEYLNFYNYVFDSEI